MLTSRLDFINTDDINPVGITGLTGKADKSLLGRVRKTGLVSPIIVQEYDGAYTIISGTEMVDAAREAGIAQIPAMIVDKIVPFKDVFELAIKERLDCGPLKATEVSLILKQLSGFGHDDAQIVKTFLPIMGYGRNPRILELYRDLWSLELEWQTLLDEDGLSIELAASLVSGPAEQRNAFLEMVKSLRLGKNRQREFWGLVRDISRILDTPVKEFLSLKKVESIIHDMQLTSAQKTEAMKAFLWEQRYPEFTVMKKKFEEILKSAKLPPEMVISSPPFFDGERFTAMLQFSTPEEFQQHLDRLIKMQDKGLVKEMLDLV